MKTKLGLRQKLVQSKTVIFSPKDDPKKPKGNTSPAEQDGEASTSNMADLTAALTELRIWI